MDIIHSPASWKDRYKPIANWDRMFADGKWDYLDEPGEAARYALIAGYIHRRAGASAVLDVGCGTGLLCRYLDGSRAEYRGIDISRTAIARAQQRFPHAAFAVHDVARYEPDPGRAFDVIVFNEVLPHLEDPIGTLSRYVGYLRPQGFVVLSTYQNVKPASNAAMFTRMLADYVDNGRFRILAGCDVTTFDQGLTWRVEMLTGA